MAAGQPQDFAAAQADRIEGELARAQRNRLRAPRRRALWARALLELARLVAFALVATIVHLALTMEIPL